MDIIILFPDGEEKHISSDETYDTEEDYISNAKKIILKELNEEDEKFIEIIKVGEITFKVEPTKLSEDLGKLINMPEWTTRYNYNTLITLRNPNISRHKKYELIQENNLKKNNIYTELDEAPYDYQKLLKNCGCENNYIESIRIGMAADALRSQAANCVAIGYGYNSVQIGRDSMSQGSNSVQIGATSASDLSSQGSNSVQIGATSASDLSSQGSNSVQIGRDSMSQGSNSVQIGRDVVVSLLQNNDSVILRPTDYMSQGSNSIILRPAY